MSDDFHIHPAAREEFNDTIRYYARVDEDGELAFDFEATFFHYLDAIVANPLLYNFRRGVTRESQTPFRRILRRLHGLEGQSGDSRRRACEAQTLLLAQAHWRVEENVLTVADNTSGDIM